MIQIVSTELIPAELGFNMWNAEMCKDYRSACIR